MVSALLAKLASLFLILGGGFILTHKNIVSKEQVRGLTLISVNLIIPCSMVNAFRVEWTKELGSGLLLSMGAAVVLNIMMVLLGTVLKRPLRLSPNEQVAVSYPNSYNLTAPIVLSMFGPEYLIYVSPYMAVQTILVWSHGRSVICGEKGFSLKKMFCNLQMGGIAIGIILLLTQWHLPGPLGDAVESLGTMVGPVSMLITGMLIGGMNLKNVVRNRRVYLSAFLRLIIAPLMEIALIKLSGAEKLLPNAHTILLITLLGSMTPSAQVLQQIAQVYDKEPEYAGAINVMTMFFCIATMPLMMMLYEAL